MVECCTGEVRQLRDADQPVVHQRVLRSQRLLESTGMKVEYKWIDVWEQHPNNVHEYRTRDSALNKLAEEGWRVVPGAVAPGPIV